MGGALGREERVHEKIRTWAEDLIDLTGKNRLLYFKHTRSASLGFVQAASEVEGRLGRRGWRFFLPEPPPPPPRDDDQPSPPEEPPLDGAEPAQPEQPPPEEDQLIVSRPADRYQPEIERALKNLHRKSRAELLDTGLWVLYLGLGVLRWRDPGAEGGRGAEVTSPLLLLPVQLEQRGAAKEWTLKLSEDGEPALNPALAVKLEKDFGIVLPSLDDVLNGSGLGGDGSAGSEPDDREPAGAIPEGDVALVLRAVAEAVADPRWQVEDEALLSTFTFHKEAIYRDLLDNREAIAQNPMVRLLVEGPSSEQALALDFEPDPEEELDRRHPPEDLMCVDDADASQRQCLVAAREGRSFVMDGPPGTGKSQTITNIIAQLLSGGKTVLFVSEKAAALEVVQKRLEALKLDCFVLPLHSHKATRKAVAQELGRALDERPKANDHFDEVHRARLRREREKLSAYAMAMNRVRHPLGKSLHDVVGRVGSLGQRHGLPDVPVPEVDTLTLDATGFAGLLDLGAALGDAWGPVARGDDFMWRDLEDVRSSAGRQTDLRERVRRWREALIQLETEVGDVCEELWFPGGQSPELAEKLCEVLYLAHRRVPVGVGALTTDAPEALDAQASQLVQVLTQCRETEVALAAATPSWQELPVELAGVFEQHAARLSGLEPPTVSTGSPLMALGVGGLRKTEADVQAAGTAVEQLLAPARRLAEVFSVPTPLTLELTERLAALGTLAGSPAPPEPSWLNPATVRAVEEAHRVLGELLQLYRSQRHAIAPMLNDTALNADLQGLQARFTQVHRGLRKLGGAYRADKRALARVTVIGKATKAAIAALPAAVAWQSTAYEVHRAERHHAGPLGPVYWPSRDEVDLDRLARAVAAASQALELAAGDVSVQALASQLGRGTAPDPGLPASAQEAGALLGTIRGLQIEGLLGVPPGGLRQLPLEEMGDWLAAVGGVLGDLAQSVEEMSGAVGRPVTLEEATGIAGWRADHARLDREAGVLTAQLGDLLGEALDGSNPETIEAARRWVLEARGCLGGPVLPQTADAVLSTERSAEPLREAVDRFHKAGNECLDVFLLNYRAQLEKEIAAPFEDCRGFLDHLEQTMGDIVEWESFVTHGQRLEELGWGPVVAACVERRVEASQVAPLLERAVLQRWVDQQMDATPELAPRRAADRDRVLEEFRRLDRELVAATAARVINTCAERRPRSLAGGAGVIRREGQKKSRHKPVRRLLTEAGEIAQRLEPCFMMSPLSVSQFLPPGLRFDAVIFDEASQVREADAISSIYRGDQLIIAGDPKQLPPTNFFQRMTDVDEEEVDEDLEVFESVLDRCKAQGLPPLPLLWHYRSRHEDLITFSNRSFYDGRLHTFPSAAYDAPDLGVTLFRVDGTYARGGLRDNKVEAEKVVDRVLHHRRHHPDLTLGVVALSGAQQSAIEHAVEHRSMREPELRELVHDDRLDGFFVKNLENVQGDERDIIILSIGYGRDETGKLTMNFGPMSKTGGERRLNVAVTRARRRVEVICSLRPGEIHTTNPTTKHLARYLDYAERGVAALALEVGESGQDAESPFEEDVLRVVRSLGYNPEPQVGVAGYRVDIGVRHPTEPGRYALGVECDGATYHSSKVARDRDRLRQEVLEGQGWTIHRIWGTAWYAEREQETERLRDAISRAVAGRQVAEVAPVTTAGGGGTALAEATDTATGAIGTTDPGAKTAGPLATEVEIESVDFDGYPDWAWAYEHPVLPKRARAIEITDPGAKHWLVADVRTLVERYGPIHRDHLLGVVREAWGLGRAGVRVREAFDRTLSVLRRAREVVEDDGFLAVGGAEPYVRVPADESAEPRPVRYVSWAERELAIRKLLEDAGPSSRASLLEAWSRLFGWRRAGQDIQAAFDGTIRRLRARSVVATELRPDGVELRLADPG